MQIYKINILERYMDFQLNSRYLSDRLGVLVGETSGLSIDHFQLEMYELSETWTVVKIKTINSKLLKAMYRRD